MIDPALVHPKETTLKPLVFGFSFLVWAVVVCSLVGACYGLILIPFVLLAHAYLLGHIRGTGVRVDASQLPDLHRRVVALSQKLQLDATPEVYVVQSGGALNAFATKLFSRTYVILFSELLDKCNSDAELDFVVAHELAHHAAGHLKTLLLTGPAKLVPLLGPAYSRACEYTCDRAALFAVDALEPSQRALAVLAAGAKAGAQLDLRSLAHQQQSAGEFWPAVAELTQSHPFLPKRVAMLEAWQAERGGVSAAVPPAPGRPPLAYVMALFFGRQAAIMVVALYLVAIVAAVAIPNLMKLREQAGADEAALVDPSLAPLEDPTSPLAEPAPEEAAPAGATDEAAIEPEVGTETAGEEPPPDDTFTRMMRYCLEREDDRERTSCLRALGDLRPER